MGTLGKGYPLSPPKIPKIFCPENRATTPREKIPFQTGDKAKRQNPHGDAILFILKLVKTSQF